MLTALTETYGRLLDTLTGTREEQGWQPTRCAGWVVRDLVHHLTADAQRALVALHTPVEGEPTVDRVTYWKRWEPGTPSAEANLRATRIMASAWLTGRALVELYDETARAVLVAAAERDGNDLVGTQGERLRVDDLISTLVVEATLHHLDLMLGEPSTLGLAEVRRVLDGLLGSPSPLADDVRYALVGTGREPLSGAERAILGLSADRFPLLG